MSYQQVQNILNKIRDCHRRFRDSLLEIELAADSVSTEQFSQSIRRHEQNWQKALTEGGDEDEKAILEAWVQIVPEEPVLEKLDGIVITPDMSVEEVSDLATQFHSTLVDLYSTLARQVTAPRAHEFFLRLADLEKTVVAQQAWSARPMN